MLLRGIRLLRGLTQNGSILNVPHRLICALNARNVQSHQNFKGCSCHIPQTLSSLNRWYAAEALSESDSEIDSNEITDQPSNVEQPLPPHKARLIEDDVHGIRDHHIARPIWSILVRLRGAGHEAYVVGGAVRDILLGRRPKDVDVLTSAQPYQVKRLFPRCLVYGRRHPIAEVQLDGYKVEVSCFATNTDDSKVPMDASVLMYLQRKERRHALTHKKNATWHGARFMNVMNRDYTINALLYDPFARILFDYVDAMSDIQQGVVRAVGNPNEKFIQDPARIIRGIRVAARTGLEIEAETSSAITQHSHLIASLQKGRLIHEMHALFAYGAAAKSLDLLWRFNILGLLMPQHEAYLKAKKYPRTPKRGRREPLFGLLQELDTRAEAGVARPVETTVWTCLLVVPLVAQRIKEMGKSTTKADAVEPTAQEEEDGTVDKSGEAEEPTTTTTKKAKTTAKKRVKGKTRDVLEVYETAVKDVMAELTGGNGAVFGRAAVVSRCTEILIMLPRRTEAITSPPFNTAAEDASLSDDNDDYSESALAADLMSSRSADERLVYQVLASSEYKWQKLTGLKALGSQDKK